MIDVSSFIIERDRLRRFCFYRTNAAVVIRDTCHNGLRDPRTDPVSRMAEWLQFMLTVDAGRFVDPDDTCDSFRSIFAFPTIHTRRDVEAILTAGKGNEAIIVDYRLSEAVLPQIAPHLACDKLNAVKIWDRALRKRKRICAIVTIDDVTNGIAIRCDGGRLLRRCDGETFDLAGPFWLAVYNEIASQRCMKREAWQQNDFQTMGSA